MGDLAFFIWNARGVEGKWDELGALASLGATMLFVYLNLNFTMLLTLDSFLVIIILE